MPEQFTDDIEETLDAADYFVGTGLHGCLEPTGDAVISNDADDNDDE